MGRKLINVRTTPVKAENSKSDELRAKIPEYVEVKSIIDENNTVAKALNEDIKKLMVELGIKEFIVNDIKASYSESTKYDFIEEKLIEKVKSLGLAAAVKTREYVDMTILEDAIYNGKINASELASCQTEKTTVTLRIGKAKK